MIGETRLGGNGGAVKGELSCGLDAWGKHLSLTDSACAFCPLGRTVGFDSILFTRVSLLNKENKKNIKLIHAIYEYVFIKLDAISLINTAYFLNFKKYSTLHFELKQNSILYIKVY